MDNISNKSNGGSHVSLLSKAADSNSHHPSQKRPSPWDYKAHRPRHLPFPHSSVSSPSPAGFPSPKQRLGTMGSVVPAFSSPLPPLSWKGEGERRSEGRGLASPGSRRPSPAPRSPRRASCWTEPAKRRRGKRRRRKKTTTRRRRRRRRKRSRP